MEEIKQIKNFSKRELRIKDNSLFYKIGGIGHEDEVVIPFEEISGEKVGNENGKIILFIGGIVSIVLAIVLVGLRFLDQDIGDFAEPFWLILGLVFLTVYYRTKEKFWKIKLNGDNYIYLHKSIPNEKSVDKFIANLMNKRNNYLLENYGQLNKYLDYEGQFQNWKWLLKMNVITPKEFDDNKLQLIQLFGKDNRQIGFRNE